MNHEIEVNETTLTALYAAFQGTGYTPRITGYRGAYTIIRRGALTVVVTQAEIAQKGVWAVVGGICAEWGK